MYAQETWTTSHPEQSFGSSESRVFWMSFNLCVSHNRPAVAVEGRICPLTVHNYQLTNYCDASSIGFASILMQRQEDGYFHPVFYFNYRTTSDKSKYHSFELEALCIVYTLQRFRIFVLKEFVTK